MLEHYEADLKWIIAEFIILELLDCPIVYLRVLKGRPSQ